MKQLHEQHGVFTLVGDFKVDSEDITYIAQHLDEARKNVGGSKPSTGKYIAQTRMRRMGVDELYKKTLITYLNKLK